MSLTNLQTQLLSLAVSSSLSQLWLPSRTWFLRVMDRLPRCHLVENSKMCWKNWPTSPASICRVFPFGRSNTRPKIWQQSADSVESECLLQSRDPPCGTIFRVFATLVRGWPRFPSLCPALFHVHEKVIAPDFSLEFAGFSPREKSRKTREISGTSREKSG